MPILWTINKEKNKMSTKKKVETLRKTFTVMALLTLIFTFGDVAVYSAKAAKSSTAAQGQLFINQGRYQDAIREFTCVINAQPTEVEGYRGRIEAELLLGQYSNALADNARITAF